MLSLSSILRTVVILLLAQAAVWIDIAPAHAFVEPCNFGDNVPKTRPNSQAGPTETRLAIFIFDLVDIITVKQEFIMDFYMETEWQDPRLGELLRKSGRRQCEATLDEVWHAEIFIINNRALSVELPEVLHIRANGNVKAQQRFIGTFAAQFDLANFPLDTQIIPLTFLSTKYGPDELKFVFEGGGREEVFTETAWVVGRARPVVGVYEIELIKGVEEETQSYARFDYEIEVIRQHRYYVWKVFVPLCVIVFASWAVFWIDPTQLAVQTGIGTAMLLTVVAFLLSLQNVIPKINFLTRLDIFVYSSLMFVFLAFGESLTTCTLAAQGREPLARRFDRWSRLIFPLAFAALLAWFWWA